MPERVNGSAPLTLFSRGNLPNYLVAIKSCHAHAARRKAVSETWLPKLDWADSFFLIGKPRTVIPDCLSCFSPDDFNAIAPKIYCACSYALNNNIDNMFVVDDDTYVHTERLQKSGFHKFDYVGFMRTNGLDYNNGIPYAQGSAYGLSARAMERIVTSGEMVPGVIDDGAVGRALVDKVPFTHEHRFLPGPNAPQVGLFPSKANNIITTHKCPPDIMHSVHKAAHAL